MKIIKKKKRNLIFPGPNVYLEAFVNFSNLFIYVLYFFHLPFK